MSENIHTSSSVSLKLLKEPKKSKSMLKKEMLNLQKIGSGLVNLSPKKLSRIEIPDDLNEAIMLAKKIKSREGKRRQIQHIGKIMRSADINKILMGLKIFDQESVAYRSQKITIEKWIKRLTLEGDKAIDDILIALPKIDRKHLRQLIRQAKKVVSEEKSKSANEKIFSYLIEFEFY